MIATRRSAVVAVAALAVVALHVIAWQQTDFALGKLVSGYNDIAEFVGEMLPPDLTWGEVLRPALDASLQTLYMGLLGTSLSVPLSLLGAILAARNTSPNPAVYQATRSVLSFLRAVPAVVFALVFVTAVGLGPFPGVLALLCHNVGVMGKLWSEAIEETDYGPVDALRVSGASGTQVVANAIVPAVTPTFVGLFLYRFDVNVRESLVLGLVGAGGIGFLINQSIKLFRFDQMLTQILVVLVMVVIVDNLSAQVRRRLAD